MPSLCLFITQSPPNGQKDPSGPKTLLPFPCSGVSRVREQGPEPCCSLGLSDFTCKTGAVTSEITSGTENAKGNKAKELGVPKHSPLSFPGRGLQTRASGERKMAVRNRCDAGLEMTRPLRDAVMSSGGMFMLRQEVG